MRLDSNLIQTYTSALKAIIKLDRFLNDSSDYFDDIILPLTSLVTDITGQSQRQYAS